ncbi:MAG TPA: NADH-quinone oxidoreductase subunit A [Dehalococcoidia bacterium]|nr:NADH-quinone oxidoreductase subunit A [Dehalococcoidia bacterium]
MLRDFGYVGLLLVVAIIFPVVTLVLSYLLHLARVRPQKPSPTKSAPYECGRDTIGPAWVQFNFRYYLYALLFVVFDIETVFLYPWAVAFKKLQLFGFVEMLIFIAILMVGYVYAWRKRALEWT